MGPKRKNNKNSRGGRNSVASRVAEFEAAAASTNTKSSKTSNSNKNIDGTKQEQNSTRKNSNASVARVDGGIDPIIDTVNDPSSPPTRRNVNLQSSESSNPPTDDNQKEKELRGEYSSNEHPISGDTLEKPKQARSTDAGVEDKQAVEAPAEIGTFHAKPENGQAIWSKTSNEHNAEEEFLPESTRTYEASLPDQELSALDVNTPQLAPSPLPDNEQNFILQDDNEDDDDGVEIIDTQNVTYMGGRPVFAKPILVAPSEEEFHANIDPNTYFADPEDAVIEEATASPNPSHHSQRVRMMGGATSVISPSTTSSVQIVKVGSNTPLSPHQVIRQSLMKPKEVQVPIATSLSEDAEILGVAVVGFHHTRGPEVEYWVGPDGDQSHLWPYLPFQSLPDGSHSFEESVCYFTLLYDRRQHRGPNPTPERDEEGHIIDSSDFNDVTTLFAVSCSRQVATADLEHAPTDATRSSIHKSIVVVARKPVFSSIKEKLTVVTRSYFEQGQFDDRTIIDRFYENLVHLYSLPQSDSDFQVGINVRDFVYRFGVNVLVIFKALLTEKRILFYASDTDLLCTFQFALISLIPNLLNHLEDCGSPLLSNYETNLVKPTYMQSSNRDSMLKFMGLPLHVFAAGGIFNPFVPLQQLDELTRKETQYGLFGSTNQLFLTAAKADIIVNIDQNCVDIVNSELTSALALSSADKAFIQPIASAVVKSWDSENKWQPRSLGYLGSDDYIRQQFEDYLLGLLASVKYEAYLQRLGPEPPKIFTRDFAPNPLKAFNLTWAAQWKLTNNFRIFNKFTDDELFDIVEPAHVATIKNRARIDAISDPGQYSSPKEDKRKGFFSGLFKRSTASEKSINESAPTTSASSTPTRPSTPAKASDSEEIGKESTHSVEDAPPSPHKLMFWR